MTHVPGPADPLPEFSSDDGLLAWIGEALIGYRDPEQVLRAICPVLAGHLGATRVGYAEVDVEARRVIVPWAFDDEATSSAVGSFDLRTDYWHMIEYMAGRTVAYADWELLPVETQERAELAAMGCKAVLCAPCLRDGRLVGLFSVMQREPRQWTASEIALVERVARMVASTLDHAQVVHRLRDSEELFRTLAESLPGICWVGGADGSAFWINEAGRRAFGEQWRGAGDERRILHPDDYHSTMELWTDAMRTVTPTEATVRVRMSDGQYRPMLSRGQPILDADGRMKRWVGLLVDLTEERLRLRGENLLRELSEATRELSDAETILDITTELLGRHLRVGRVAFSDIDPTEPEVYRVQRDWTDGAMPSVTGSVRLSDMYPEVAAIYRGGVTATSIDVRDDSRLGPETAAALEQRGIRSAITVPLMRDAKVVAVLAVQQAQPRIWSADEVQLVEQVAERTWSTLARAAAERALRERERMQSILLQWSDAVRAELSPREILRRTLSTIGRELSVARVNFAEADADGTTLVVEDDWVDGLPSVAGQRFPLAALGGRVVAEHLSGRPFHTCDSRADPRFDPATMASYEAVGARAFISIPLVRGERLVGVLSIQDAAPRNWSDAEVALLSELADRTWAILERARSEERLAESEALLAAYLANAPIAMYLKDADGRYIHINDEMANMLDVRAEDAIGRTAFEVADRDLAARVTELDHAALTDGVQSGVLEFGMRERYQTLLSIRFPIPSLDGAASKLGGFTLDLTDQRRAEAALERSREALYQSEKLNALGSLLAGVSHELNNPLSIVVAQAVMMERQAAGSPLAERAYKIRKAADRCARIVQTFLAMARQRQPERRSVDVNTVVLSVLELADYGLKTDGIEVATTFAPDLPMIAADADQLHQVILNLLLNAQHAMTDAGVPLRKISVTTGRGDGPRTVAIDIIDSGPGIPPELRRRVFEPFFTTKPQGEGTGVGLSFSQGLVEAHGGRLELIDSARGAHFRLTLPIEAGPALPAVAETTLVATVGTQRRALIIDDEREIAESLADFLGLEGFVCEIVDGGGAAIDRLSSGAGFDLVISDLRMPDVDGPAVYAWIVANRADLTARTAFATGDTLGSAVSRFIADAGRPVLEKPFMPDGVRRLLHQMEG